MSDTLTIIYHRESRASSNNFPLGAIMPPQENNTTVCSMEIDDKDDAKRALQVADNESGGLQIDDDTFSLDFHNYTAIITSADRAALLRMIDFTSWANSATIYQLTTDLVPCEGDKITPRNDNELPNPEEYYLIDRNRCRASHWIEFNDEMILVICGNREAKHGICTKCSSRRLEPNASIGWYRKVIFTPNSQYSVGYANDYVDPIAMARVRELRQNQG